jgi:hypothetical protein
MRPTRPLAPATLALALALTAGGCAYTEGGPGYSADQHVYVSRPWQPWTVTLRDTRTGQEFWSADVPVGKKLVIQFADNGGTKDKYTPSLMTWGIMDEERDWTKLTNSMPVPAADSRRLEPTLRAVPELPESMVTATKGTLQPAKPAAYRPPSVSVPAPAPRRDGEDLPTPPPPPPAPPAAPAPGGAPGADRP